MKLDWTGGLKEYRAQYTALELQKEAVDWWESISETRSTC